MRQFEKQFLTVYGERFLFLCPPNEFDLPKFLPTTLRPTHLAYRELYDFQSCALFLADFLNYEYLQPPNRYPHVIPSPASVIQWRAGDCFDFSTVLCSLLLGVGYDAYCVSGFAPRYVTLRNETRQKCPKLSKRGAEEKKDKEEDEHAVTIEKKVPLKSAFEAKRRAAERKQKEEEELERLQSGSDDDPSSDEDEHENQRIHCWVLVRKHCREVAEDVFIEPSTGRVYPVSASPYLRIDLIWNHRNLWVNMQQIPANDVNLDLMSSQYFEYVLREEATKRGPAGVLEEAGGEHEAREDQDMLDIPASWSERLDISREAFAERCYEREKTTLYEQCKVETYAVYSQVDGLVERVTQYKDLRRQNPLQISEKFMQRRDHLMERRRKPMENELVEVFRPGRQHDKLKEFHEKAAVRRELRYYHQSRLDGLVLHHEEIGKKIWEVFEDRDDRLIYHSVTLDHSLKGQTIAGKPLATLNVDEGDFPIRKMARKYAPPAPGETPEHPYRKIVFFLAENPPKVRLDYHCDPGRITSHSLTLWRDDNKLAVEEPGRRDCPLPTAQQLNKLLQMERNCQEAFKEALKNTHEALRLRKNEENNICAWRSIDKDRGDRDREVLVDSVYDLARKRAREAAAREGVEEEKAEEQSHKVDILAPYLVDFQGGPTGGWKPLDALQAEFVHKKCRNDFRRRLLDRAGIIQKRLEEEQDNLKKRRSQMQRRGDNVDKDERAFETYQSDAMFRIQILEQRLARHETLAIKKFAELDKALTEDKRLEAMWIKQR